MQAIILAAGMGKRLKGLTQNNTKCMVKVNGITLIDRMMNQLEKQHLSRIVIVVGYEGQKLINYIETLHIQTPIVYVNNSVYDKTNNIYSLALAKEFLMSDDTILLESDLIFEDDVLKILLEDKRETLALVDKYESWMDGTCIKISENDEIEAFIPGRKFVFEDISKYYKTVNIYKFSKHFSETCYVPFLEAYLSALGNNEYYEQVLRVITMLDEPEIKAKKLNGQLWYEIDDIQDLDIASSIFTETQEGHYDLLEKRYGGYWRYPKVLDYIHLGNPYYPEQKMKNEIKASFDVLLCDYPSGQSINSLLVAKNYNIEPEQVVVANGLEEIIKSIMSVIDGNIGIVKPINEEYLNRCAKEKAIKYFDLLDKDYSISIKEIIAFYSDLNIKMLVISNPNNHIGKYINKNEFEQLLIWTNRNHILLFVDESYCDYTNEMYSLMDISVLNEYENLIVARDISAAEGVAGIRLGCVASGNIKLIQILRKDVSIWNINSIAEFYLQISEKYRKEYKIAIEKFKVTKQKFFDELSDINGIKVYNTDSNFLLLQLEERYSSKEFAAKLLSDHRILVKDIKTRIEGRGEYIRISIHSERENEYFADAVRKMMREDIEDKTRITGKEIEINNEKMKLFFENRNYKSLPHRYNYVIYQDSNPELALKRDAYEKSKFLKYLRVKEDSIILDIGCGVGRWGDELIPYLNGGKYIGVDFSMNLLEIARKELSNTGKCDFYCGDFREICKLLADNGICYKFDTILINGVLMYINDSDIAECMRSVNKLIANGGVIYIKESVGRDERLTLNNFFSSELGSTYSAIYRSVREYAALFDEYFNAEDYNIVSEGETWESKQQNRSDTTSYYWIIERK